MALRQRLVALVRKSEKKRETRGKRKEGTGVGFTLSLSSLLFPLFFMCVTAHKNVCASEQTEIGWAINFRIACSFAAQMME